MSKGNDTYAPYFEQGNISTLGMAYVLKDWLHITAAAPKMYLAIKEIYPFSDLRLLAETGERLYQLGIPFLASVRPVFSNTDYPAMQRYLVAMKSVQSSNGSILVNAPVVMPTISSGDHTLKGKMNDFINLLAENGLGPLGVGAEMHWSYDKEYSEAGMSFLILWCYIQMNRLIIWSRATPLNPFHPLYIAFRWNFFKLCIHPIK